MSKKLIMRKDTVKKIAEEQYGLTNVEIHYHKSEGWWIECDQLDDWICIDSGGIVFGLNRLTEKLKK